MKYSLLIAGFVTIAHLAVGQLAAVPADAGSFSGKVVETTNAAGYTYVLADNGAKKIWAAAPTFEVKPGDSVKVPLTMPMENFHSKTMNRDFAEIYFTGDIAVNGAQPAATQLPPGHPNIGGNSGATLPPNHPALPGQTAPAKVDLSGLKPAAGGQTIADIYAASAQLNGQPVVVRGKVVKYNPGIMGRNWVHIQDGTGSDGSNDLLVTTTDEVKLGDTVLVHGTLATKKDFGAGYKYSVLIEGAKVTVE